MISKNDTIESTCHKNFDDWTMIGENDTEEVILTYQMPFPSELFGT